MELQHGKLECLTSFPGSARATISCASCIKWDQLLHSLRCVLFWIVVALDDFYMFMDFAVFFLIWLVASVY